MGDRYLNNPLLPKAGTKKEWTPHMVEEYIKCQDDPVYFAEAYFKIVHVDHGLIPFKLYDFQREIIEEFQTTRKMILNQSRQSGKTSVATVLLLHFALFNGEKTIGVLANKADTAKEIMGRIQKAYEHLPDFLKGGVKEWNKHSITFENDSKIIASASGASSIRGKSLSLLAIDEMSFVQNFSEFAASVLPTLSSGTKTKMIFTSTPNGLNHFYEYCEGAKKGANGFKYKEVPWDMVPGRDEKWKQETMEQLNHDDERFQSEYNCQFLGSSGTLIAGWKLKQLTPHMVIQHDEDLNQYEKPQDGHRYIATVDVSRGKGLDFSAIQIIDVTELPYRQVAVYRSNDIGPSDFAVILYSLAKSYNEAFILVEINDIGEQVSDILYHDFEYENILFTESTKGTDKRISAGFSKKQTDMGIRTTKRVKDKGCALLKLLVEQDKLEISDMETIFELSTFSKKGKSYEAEEGKNDDLVMCLVIFAWLTEQDFFEDICDTNIMNHLREKSDEAIFEQLMPFAIVNDGRGGEGEEVLRDSDGSVWHKEDSFLL